jgi:hypothetical protein
MEKPIAGHITKFIIALGVVAVCLWIFETKSPEQVFSKFNQNINSRSNSSASSVFTKFSRILGNDQKEDKLFEISQNCLGKELAIGSISQINDLILKMGPYETYHHWDNYHYENTSGQKMIIQVVADQLDNGTEIQQIKEFRDDEDGPTFLKETIFLDPSKLKFELDEKLKNFNVKKQTTESLNFKSGIDLKRTTEDGVVMELKISNSSGVLDCEIIQDLAHCSCR